MVLNAELDNLIINGDPSSTAAEPSGLIDQLTAPADPAAVVTWPSGISTVAAGIDGGPWAESLADLRAAVQRPRRSASSRRCSRSTPRPAPTARRVSLRTLRANIDTLFSSSRMPDTDSTVATAVLLRLTPRPAGAGGAAEAMSMAEVPTWGMVLIDDPYTDAAAGTVHVTVSALVGDVALRHDGPYQLVKFDLS